MVSTGDYLKRNSERIPRSLTSMSSVESLRGKRANLKNGGIPYGRRFPEAGQGASIVANQETKRTDRGHCPFKPLIPDLR